MISKTELTKGSMTYEQIVKEESELLLKSQKNPLIKGTILTRKQAYDFICNDDFLNLSVIRNFQMQYMKKNNLSVIDSETLENIRNYYNNLIKKQKLDHGLGFYKVHGVRNMYVFENYDFTPEENMTICSDVGY